MVNNMSNAKTKRDTILQILVLGVLFFGKIYDFYQFGNKDVDSINCVVKFVYLTDDCADNEL